MEPVSVDVSVVAAISKLNPIEIPKHLMHKSPVRTEADFDPMAYFSVLTHLSIKPGYTIDYVYDYMDDFGGNPYLYARAIDEKPLTSFNEYEEWEKKNSLLSFLRHSQTRSRRP